MSVSLHWWMFVLAALVFAGASAFCAMLGLSAGTAYATDYHTLSPRQRVMARMLGFGSIAAALLSGLLALALLAWGLHELWLLL